MCHAQLHDRLSAASALVPLLQKAIECEGPTTQPHTPTDAHAPGSMTATAGAKASKGEGGKGGASKRGRPSKGGGGGVSKALEERLGKALQRLDKLPSVNQVGGRLISARFHSLCSVVMSSDLCSIQFTLLSCVMRTPGCP